MLRFLSLLTFAALMLAGCAGSNDDHIESRVHELVDALNKRDQAAAGALFAGGALQPLTLSGDSSAIYRLITIPGGGEFDAENVSSSVVGSNAQTTFDLTGDVRRGDSLMGTMTLHLKLELQKDGEDWKFVPGGEIQQEGLGL